MNRFGKIAFCFASGLTLSAGLRAADLASANTSLDFNRATPDAPYAPIVARNVFGLLPPAPPPDPNAAVTADLPKITVSGIMDVFGNLKVLFKTPGAGKEAKEIYYDLSPGEAENDIEVVSIDEGASKVTFKNHGTTQQLALSKESSSGGGGNSGGGSTKFPMPTAKPMGQMGGNGITSFSSGFAGHDSYGGGINNSSSSGFSGTSFGNNGGSRVGTPSNLPQYPSTAEQQAVALEVERAATQQQVDEGTMPPFPPTPLTPENATGSRGVPLVVPPIP